MAYCVKCVVDVLCLEGTESSRQLKLKSLKLLKSIYAVSDNIDMLAQFFPGMTTAFCKITLGDFKIGSTVIQETLQCWSLVITKTLGNFIIKSNSVFMIFAENRRC